MAPGSSSKCCNVRSEAGECAHDICTTDVCLTAKPRSLLVVVTNCSWLQGPRYSIAFFNQANINAIIESPGGTYPPITGGEFVAQAMKANFDTKYREGANDSPFLAEEAYLARGQVPVQAAA